MAEFQDYKVADLNLFYDLLAELEHRLHGKRTLGECTAKLGWPRRGVYFFFEPGEYRSLRPNVMRVVRVGTHAISSSAKSTLWGRIRSHKGTTIGAGNHRGSVFRLLVGSAILNKDDYNSTYPHWGKGSSASKEIRLSENGMESAVSSYMAKMSLLWISIDDEPSALSKRSYIEKNSIGLLSNHESPIDKPSEGWLGRYCSSFPSVVKSGLWNSDHTQANYERTFLETFSSLISTL